MRIRFTAAHMREYQGIDGLGGSLKLARGDEAPVSESVGKLLCQKYGKDFVVVEAKAEHAPTTDKLFRKGARTKTK
jgi:hypothetical protein